MTPNLDSFSRAAAAADWAGASNFAVDMLDSAGPGAWPIVSATFVLLPTDPKVPARGAAVIQFFDWAFGHGAQIATSLNYVTLPGAVQAEVRAAWSQVRR